MDNEERILTKLDSIESHSREMLVGLTRVEEQVKDIPELKNRVASLERWKWTAMGALATASTSLTMQLVKALGPS